MIRETYSPVSARPSAARPASPRAATAVRTASTFVGDRYVWGAGHGGRSHGAVDCSGLIQQIAARMGVSFTGTAADMARRGTPVSMKDLKPGDLLFHGHPATHVGIYVGNGMVTHASSTKGHVVTVSLSTYHYFQYARRVF